MEINFLWILLLLQGSAGDPIVRKYVASGLSRAAVPYAVATYGDNPAKVFFLSSLPVH